MVCIIDENLDLKVEFDYEEFGIIRKLAQDYDICMYQVLHAMLEKELQTKDVFAGAVGDSLLALVEV